MNIVTQAQFEQIRANFSKLRSELNKEKLAEFAANVTFFKDFAPWQASDKAASRHQWQQLQNEVTSAQRAAELHATTGETANYRRFKADAEAGICHQPDNKSESLIELREKLWSDPARYHKLRESLGGLTKADHQRELPE